MHLVGLDIGYSPRRRTNAIADYNAGQLTLSLLYVEERNEALKKLSDVDVIAIDAPILPAFASADLARKVESTFSRGLFQRRCKPGMSHLAGTGRQLREHGNRAAGLSSGSAANHSLPDIPRVVAGSNVVEAFPNAFLGVAIEDSDYNNQPGLRRGRKFDWLYNCWIARDLFTRATAAAGLPPDVAVACQEQKDHEKRAALVCLLTAAFAASDRFVAVGHSSCGFFFLPPRSLWADWAWRTLQENQSRDKELNIWRSSL